jgi:hypothetical protein
MENKLVIIKAKWKWRKKGQCTVMSNFDGLEVQQTVVRFPVGANDLCVLQSVQTASGRNQPPSQWIPKDLPQGMKWPRRESDHSVKSDVKFRKDYSNIYSCPLCVNSVQRDTLFLYCQILRRLSKNTKKEGSITRLLLFTDEGPF